MSWTPPSKFTVILSFLLLVGGFYILIELFFNLTGVLPVIGFAGFTNTESWAIIALAIIFFSWILFYLGVQLKGL
jgi:hypothetical protein